MNTLCNQPLRAAYKLDDDLYNTKYEIDPTTDQGYMPNFPVGLDRPKAVCRVGGVEMPRLAVQ